jgi:hypothetical protein
MARPKGIPSHNKGKKLGKNPAHSIRMKGKIPWSKGKKGLWIAWNKGKPAPWAENLPQRFKKGQKSWNSGKPNYKWIGQNNPNWKGGITPINLFIRHTLEYKLWRKSVFERDNYTCIWCKQKGGVLNADHIKPFSQYPELRFAIDNGRTLCVDCHRTTDTYGNKTRK